MKTIETSIIINAPVERVWMILTRLDNYRHWNPFIVDAFGQLVVGQKIELHKAMPMRHIPHQSNVTVCNDMSHKLCWTTTWIHASLLSSTSSFAVEAVDEKTTCLVQVESQQGLASILSLQSMRHSLRSSMVSMNKALKREAENNRHRLPHSWSDGA